MFRGVGIRCIRSTRTNSQFSKSSLTGIRFEADTDAISNRKEGLQRSFGKVVDGDEAIDSANVIERDDLISNSVLSPYRHHSGAPIQGKNAHEARLLPVTLRARTYRDQLELNTEVAQAIKNNILSLHIPNNIRRSAANYFVAMYRTKLHRPTRTALEVDSHIASIFLQNYGSIYQSLAELRKRVGDDLFNPKRILDVGYGPATGIVALNDLMGDKFKPELKEAVILGNIEMEKRAKIILSRQLNEVPDEMQSEYSSKANTEQEVEHDDNIVEGEDLVGEVMTKKINIKTKLRNNIPKSGTYDLIILTHQLLKDEERYPIQIDDNLEHYLAMLAPGGHIVMVERGNPLGFETISRARQIMIRPENYLEEHGKIPRPWIRGFSKQRKDKPEEKNEHENDIGKENGKEFMAELDKQFGAVEDKDLEFEQGLLEEMKKREKEQSVHINYHLKIIAPCPHHRKCPLQIGNPKYYEHEEGKKLKFCNFQKSIVRPKFSIELKKGKILATRWQEPSDGLGMDGLAKAGTGRPNGRNFEIPNYSYLIAERSLTDVSTVSKIENQRQESKANYGIGSLGDNTAETWPRIINQPLKRKGHVTMELCGSSGELEKWVIPKSFTKEIYHDARKAMKGDLWGCDAKTKIRGAANINVKKFEALEKERIKKLRREAKKKDREVSETFNEIHNEGALDDIDNVDTLASIYGHDYKQASKRKDKKHAKKRVLTNEHE